METLIDIGVTVDGSRVAAAVRPRLLLSDFLRQSAGAIGVHVGCGQGLCGACTVVLDGVPVRACLMLAVQADGADVKTIASLAVLEGVAAHRDGLAPAGAHAGLAPAGLDPGLAPAGLDPGLAPAGLDPGLAPAGLDEHELEGLTPLQLSFRAHHALQCGFCTPGLLVSTAVFLAENPKPTRQEILDHLNGHLCRCSGYANIIAAIEAMT